ncbi:hypothetical protein [Tardiphaga sp. vice278]|nr:hypothetical protein [Tardiphaga sp. vice278]QDM16841.1 hypothetical protein FNL53_13550 [Tardiphaga sp. vice278]
MIESPSIVPDLAAIAILAKKYFEAEGFTAEQDRMAMDLACAAMSADHPDYNTARWLVSGVKSRVAGIEGTMTSAQNRLGAHLDRNIPMAHDCIKCRDNPIYDEKSDKFILLEVGTKYGLTSLDGATNAARDGLRDEQNQRRMRESAGRRRPFQKRSIFDGSK